MSTHLNDAITRMRTEEMIATADHYRLVRTARDRDKSRSHLAIFTDNATLTVTAGAALVMGISLAAIWM